MFFNQKTEKKESAHLNAEKQEEVQKFNIK